MNKNSIDENKAIQDGLEKFLDRELDLSGEDNCRETDFYEEESFEEETFEDEIIRSINISRSSGNRERQPENRRPENRRPAKSGQQKRRQPQNSPKKSRQQNDTRKKKQKRRADTGKKGVKKKEKKKSKWKRVLFLILLVVIAVFIWWYITVGKIYDKMSYEKTPGLASEAMKQDGVTNVLLIGNDSREGGEDGRSDAMILLSISNETKTIHMTSLLRDMYVEIPGHDGNRLNAAYAYGGPTLLCETIEQNFGIEVNRYVLVNFQAFAALVDAVGGIDLEVTNEEVQWINAYLNEYNLLEGREMTTDYLDTSLSGEIHLNGPQALAYSRNRYIGTDFGRTERQRKVLNAVIKKLPLAFATNQNELISELFPNLTTNLTQPEVFRLSMDAGKLLSYEIVQTVIPAEGTYSNATIRGMAVLEVDFAANKAVIQKEIYGKE